MFEGVERAIYGVYDEGAGQETRNGELSSRVKEEERAWKVVGKSSLRGEGRIDRRLRWRAMWEMRSCWGLLLNG